MLIKSESLDISAKNKNKKCLNSPPTFHIRLIVVRVAREEVLMVLRAQIHIVVRERTLRRHALVPASMIVMIYYYMELVAWPTGLGREIGSAISIVQFKCHHTIAR